MSTRTFSPNLLTGLALAGSALLATPAAAQMMPTVARQAKLYNTVSVHLNAMNYFGDLVPGTAFTSFRFGATRPNLGVSFSHRFAPRITGRASLSYGRITGDDKKKTDQNDKDAIYRYNRNLRFRNDIVEVSTVALIDLFENRGTYLKRRDFSPYVFLGLAGFYHNPKGNDQRDGKGNWVALQPIGTEGQQTGDAVRAQKGYDDPYKRVQISIPFGLGVNYKLSRQLNLGYEIGWRKTFTDYLDDVSGNYADPADLKDARARLLADPSEERFNDPNDPDFIQFGGAYGNRISKRGTNNEDDWYIVSGFHLSYILIPDTKSPKFR